MDHILVDRMNYHYADRIYKTYGMEENLTDKYFNNSGRLIEEQCEKEGISCRVVY